MKTEDFPFEDVSFQYVASEDVKPEDVLSPQVYQNSLKFLEIGHRGVAAARARNRELGIPNVDATWDGRLYWELPNGEITFDDPDVESEG